jgi:hypothetical protein
MLKLEMEQTNIGKTPDDDGGSRYKKVVGGGSRTTNLYATTNGGHGFSLEFQCGALYRSLKI